MSFRAVLIDDEPPARKKLRHLLAGHPDCVVAGEAGSFDEAVAVVAATRPDLLFLDIQLGQRNGFEVLAALEGREEMNVVFVTAYAEYAVQAFRVEAFDYLLKPVAPDVFDQLLDRLRRRGRAPVRRFLVEVRPGVEAFLGVDRIDWFESARNYVVLHCGGESFILRATLEAIHRRLDPARFARINRSAVVHVEAIESMRPATNGEYRVRLRDGHELLWSRRFVSAALAALLGKAR